MDGKGQTLVYYFSLPEGWEPGQVQNPAALALAQRFINDGRESDRWAAGPGLFLSGSVGRVLPAWIRARSPQGCSARGCGLPQG